MQILIIMEARYNLHLIFECSVEISLFLTDSIHILPTQADKSFKTFLMCLQSFAFRSQPHPGHYFVPTHLVLALFIARQVLGLITKIHCFSH